MGNITHLDIQQILDRTKIDNFIETGTGENGIAVSYALTLPIENIMSIEIEEKLYEHCKFKFAKEDRVKLFCGHSPEVLNKILPVEGTTLYWLDAHFPGVDSTLTNRTIQATTDVDQRCPLEKELDVIYEKGGFENDYFVIDDLRVYEDGPFETGNWAERSIYGRDGIDFIYKLFDNTHTVKKLYHDQGYVVLLPK